MDGAVPLSQSTLHNRLLRTLSPEDFGLLQPHLEHVPANLRDLIEPNEPIEHMHFPEQGVASIVANTNDGRRIEVGIYGRDGMSGTAVLLGTNQTPHENFIQVPGSLLRMEAAHLRNAIRQSPSLHNLLLRYVQAFQVQTAYTALSNGGYSIDERLARWLLMCHDRLDGDELPITHEFLGIMLAVRRSSVTLAIQVLEQSQGHRGATWPPDGSRPGQAGEHRWRQLRPSRSRIRAPDRPDRQRQRRRHQDLGPSWGGGARIGLQAGESGSHLNACRFRALSYRTPGCLATRLMTSRP
jgi:CRP-like cAMP-binding protein